MTGYRLVPIFVAWVVALVATLGALFVGEVLGQAPCVLCWYQRIAMFPLPIILGIAYLRGDTNIGVYALPLALVGTAFAAWHTLLYLGILPAAVEPCGIGPSCRGENMTILGVIPLPILSLGAFAAISISLSVFRRRTYP